MKAKTVFLDSLYQSAKNIWVQEMIKIFASEYDWFFLISWVIRIEISTNNNLFNLLWTESLM